MKRILSLILALVVCLSFSVSSLAAVSGVINFYDQSTGTNYFFGRFEDTDEQVGFQINGKEYVLDEEAYSKAKDASNLFGIGIRDERGILDTTYYATPYSYTGGVKTLYEDLKVSAVNYDYNRNMLETLTIKGKEINAFSPYRTWYHYVLNEGETLEASDIVATPKMELSTSVVTEIENGFLVTTSSNYADPFSVVIIPVTKGEYQAAQSAPLTGYKNMNLYYPEIGKDSNGDPVYAEEAIVTVNTVEGSVSIYDSDELRMKAPYTQAVAQVGKTNPYGMALIQFDISNITNINDKVILNLPARLKGTDLAGEIGIIAVENEAPMVNEVYYKGSKEEGTAAGSDAYNAASEALLANPTQSMINAISMINLDKADFEIAPRAQVTFKENANNVETTKEFDVTDYVRSKVLAGEDTVTFALRAFHNAVLSGSMDYEAQVTVATKKATLSFTGYEGSVALSDLKVNGESIKGFDPNTNAYSVIVKDGEIPVVEGFVSDNENLKVSVTQATEVPGTATVKVTSYEGQTKTYTIRLDKPFERGTFTLSSVYDMEMSTSNGAITKYTADHTGNETIRGRSQSLNEYGRYVPVIKFDTTSTGLNDNDRIILTFSARAIDWTYNNPPASNGEGARVNVTGVSSEDYVYNTVLPVVNRSYHYTTDTTMTTDGYTEFSYDVTDYVKSKLLAGETSVSFVLEMLQSLSNRDAALNMYMHVPFNTYSSMPKLEYKNTSVLSSLSYNGNEINLEEGKTTYTVVLDSDEIPVVTATSDVAVPVVEQASSVPGSATVAITANGETTVYTINFINDSYMGEITLLNKFIATKQLQGTIETNKDGTYKITALNENTALPVRNTSSTKSPLYFYLRDEGLARFSLSNFYGIDTDTQKITLRVTGYGDENSAGYTKFGWQGVINENYYNTTDDAITTKYVVDAVYGEYAADVIPADCNSSSNPTTYTFDVTDYILNKLSSSEDVASIALRVDNGTSSTAYSSNSYFRVTNVDIIIESK